MTDQYASGIMILQIRASIVSSASKRLPHTTSNTGMEELDLSEKTKSLSLMSIIRSLTMSLIFLYIIVYQP